ncbi:hypothetical protein BJ508DRAFT_409897, partial [Ascobolus immersus RN42]
MPRPRRLTTPSIALSMPLLLMFGPSHTLPIPLPEPKRGGGAISGSKGKKVKSFLGVWITVGVLGFAVLCIVVGFIVAFFEKRRADEKTVEVEELSGKGSVDSLGREDGSSLVDEVDGKKNKAFGD